MTLHDAARTLLAAVLTAALVWMPMGAAPQEPPPDARTLPQIRVDVSLVLVEATVKDRAGRIVGDLQKEDFRLFEDGAEQSIEHFSRDQLPLAVALVVDLSGSIEPFLRPLRYATLTALRTLKDEDEVALFAFSSDVEKRVELTRDKRAVADEIEFFSAAGATNINDAVYEAARYLGRAAPAARRVIVLVSDNVPTDSGRVTARNVAEAALEADAAVYGIKVPGRNPPMARAAARLARPGMVNVSKLAEETGGEVFDIEKEGSLFLAFQTLIERLKTRYTLGFYPAKQARSGFRALEVRLASARGTRGKDYTVLAKRGYYATRSSSASR
jgi:Ca-activated chloride channel family protein